MKSKNLRKEIKDFKYISETLITKSRKEMSLNCKVFTIPTLIVLNEIINVLKVFKSLQYVKILLMVVVSVLLTYLNT